MAKEAQVKESDVIVTPAVLAMVGRQTEPEVAPEPISRGDHRRYVQAIMSDHPLWYDEQYAKKTIYGANRTAAAFTLRSVNVFKRPLGSPDILRKKGPNDDARGDLSPESALRIPFPPGVASFHGGDEVEYFQMPKIGDVLTLVTKITKIVEKTGRTGKIAVAYMDRIYTNQRGEVVAINHHFNVARHLQGDAWKKSKGGE